MLVPSLLWMALPGCESEADVAADMERSLREANVAVVGALVSAELLSHVYEDPDVQLRHGTSICGCPCTQRIGGADAPFVLTLDYNSYGCVPESGLLPTALTGHAAVDFDGSECNVSWDGLLFALEHEVDGDLSGTVDVTDVTTIDTDGALIIGPETIDVDLHLVIDDAGVKLDGRATVTSNDPRPIDFHDVDLPFEEISPPCPAPTEGTATLVNADHEKKNVIVGFGDPGDGFVTVTRDDRVSESADWCAYASDLW